MKKKEKKEVITDTYLLRLPKGMMEIFKDYGKENRMKLAAIFAEALETYYANLYSILAKEIELNDPEQVTDMEESDK